MAKPPDVIGVPLPILPEGYRWRFLGKWIDLHNAGTLPQMDQEAFLDLSGQLLPLPRKDRGSADTEGQDQ